MDTMACPLDVRINRVPVYCLLHGTRRRYSHSSLTLCCCIRLFYCFIPIQSKGLLLLKNLLLLVYFSDKYVSDAQNLHEHVMRHNHGTDENGSSINCLKIVFDTEYPF